MSNTKNVNKEAERVRWRGGVKISHNEISYQDDTGNDAIAKARVLTHFIYRFDPKTQLPCSPIRYTLYLSVEDGPWRLIQEGYDSQVYRLKETCISAVMAHIREHSINRSIAAGHITVKDMRFE